MNGICYATLASNANAFERQAEEHLIPLSNSEDQITSKNNINIYNYGVGQVGFSLHMNSRYSVNVAIGSPGIYNWKGDAILTVSSMVGSFSRTVIPSLAREQRVHSYNYFGKDIFPIVTFFYKVNIAMDEHTPQNKNILFCYYN